MCSCCFEIKGKQGFIGPAGFKGQKGIKVREYNIMAHNSDILNSIKGRKRFDWSTWSSWVSRREGELFASRVLHMFYTCMLYL